MQTHNTDIASLSVCPSVILLYTCTIKTTERFPVNILSP